MLQKKCIKKQKVGFAFDGDGDRIFVIDKDGTIINGDKILFILSKFFQKTNDICVGTIYSNTGLEKALYTRQIQLKRSDVGDKKVYEMMKAHQSCLGGEDSGHIILKHFMNTGDGVLIAIIVANIIELSKLTLKEILNDYKEHFQIRKDIKLSEISNISKLEKNQEIKDLIISLEKIGCKIIVRPSGTEPLLRLFVEHESREIAQKSIDILYQTLLEHLI